MCYINARASFIFLLPLSQHNCTFIAHSRKGQSIIPQQCVAPSSSPQVWFPPGPACPLHGVSQGFGSCFLCMAWPRFFQSFLPLSNCIGNSCCARIAAARWERTNNTSPDGHCCSSECKLPTCRIWCKNRQFCLGENWSSFSGPWRRGGCNQRNSLLLHGQSCGCDPALLGEVMLVGVLSPSLGQSQPPATLCSAPSPLLHGCATKGQCLLLSLQLDSISWKTWGRRGAAENTLIDERWSNFDNFKPAQAADSSSDKYIKHQRIWNRKQRQRPPNIACCSVIRSWSRNFHNMLCYSRLLVCNEMQWELLCSTVIRLAKHTN